MGYPSLIKPPIWALQPGLVAPKWKSFWKDNRFCVGFMPSGASGFDLSGNLHHLKRIGSDVGIRSTAIGTGYDYTGGIASYMEAPDTPALSITGGLTIAAIFVKDAASVKNAGIVSKYAGTDSFSNQRSYVILTNEQGGDAQQLSFIISPDGTFASAIAVNTASAAITLGKLHKVVARYSPSTFMKIRIDNTETTNTTSIPSAIFDSTAPLWIGNQFGDIEVNSQLNGGIVFATVSARIWSDAETEKWFDDSFGPIRMADEVGVVIGLPVVSGRIMSSLAGSGGLAGHGGIAGVGGGLAA